MRLLQEGANRIVLFLKFILYAHRSDPGKNDLMLREGGESCWSRAFKEAREDGI